jgi:hypothetical protein
MDLHVKTVQILPLACAKMSSSYAQGAMKSFPSMLSVRLIVSAYAQHAHAIIFENYSKIPNLNANFDYKNFWISLQKIWFRVCSVMAKMFDFEILAKIEGKGVNFFPKICQGNVGI